MDRNNSYNSSADTGLEETTFTFIAPDGYAKDISYSEIYTQYADGLFYANLDADGFTDADQAFVEYPAESQLPAGLVDC